MDPRPVFDLINLVVLPFWFLLIFLPRWRWTERLCGSPWIVAPTAIAYVVLLVPSLLGGETMDLSGPPRLDDIVDLLSSPTGATIAWAHFLTFDLFVGRWVWRDGARRGLTSWVTAPALVLTFLLGPVGLLVHLGTRALAGPKEPDAASEDDVAGADGDEADGDETDGDASPGPEPSSTP